MELFYMHKVLNKVDYIISGWETRRKLDNVMFDITAIRGKSLMDHRKGRLLKHIDQFLVQDYKITTLSAEATGLRYDVSITLEKLPGLIMKDLNSKFAQTETYDFTYGPPISASNSRKRHWEGMATTPCIPKRYSFGSTWRQAQPDQPLQQPSTIAETDKTEETPEGLITLNSTRRARKNRKIRFLKQKKQQQQFTAECAEVTTMVDSLQMTPKPAPAEKLEQVTLEQPTRDNQRETPVDQPTSTLDTQQQEQATCSAQTTPPPRTASLSDYNDDLDLEQAVNSWYDITKEQEIALLGTSVDDELPNISVDEITFLLDGMASQLDTRFRDYR